MRCKVDRTRLCKYGKCFPDCQILQNSPQQQLFGTPEKAKPKKAPKSSEENKKVTQVKEKAGVKTTFYKKES